MAPGYAEPQLFDDASRAPVRSSVFRAIMSSKPHKRNPSADDATAPKPLHKHQHPGTASFPFGGEDAPLPLGEITPNRDGGDGATPAKKQGDKVGKGALHKKTMSAVSLKSLRNYMERKDAKSEETPNEESDGLKPKKTKSANSLSAILKRSQRGRKSRDKENRSPTDLVDNMPPPMWPQDSIPSSKGPATRPTGPSSSDKRRSVAEEVSLYTPKDYNPAQQRNFYDYHQPSLARPANGKPRPKSDCLSGNRKVKDLLTPLQRTSSGESEATARVDIPSSKSRETESPRKISAPSSQPTAGTKDEPNQKRLSRVQAAISSFSAKGKDGEMHQNLDSKDIESEFEKLLVGCL